MPPPNPQLKRQALELAEWALKDMSPDGDHPLHFKCGFEREGHFLPESLPAPEKNPEKWLNKNKQNMRVRAGAFTELLKADERLDKIFHDDSGTFKLEAITKPLGLLEATDAITDISGKMLDSADVLKLSPAGFGSVPASALIDSLNETAQRTLHAANYARSAFKDYGTEVLDIPGEGRMLPAHAQHCNLSLWEGERNLFSPTEGPTGNDLVNHATEKALEWLPHMFLPGRQGNYFRIQAGNKLVTSNFSAGYLGSVKGAGHALRYTGDRETPETFKPESYRLEFRMGAANADPYDLALASALPLVKTCDDALEKDERGKVKLGSTGAVTLRSAHAFPTERNAPAPRNEEEAKALFNAPENPYFAYLNELAERKIRSIEAQAPSQTNRLALDDARKLRGIGTRLYDSYCEQYGLENNMPRLHGRAAVSF